MSADHDLARQWLAKARNDLLNADNNLKSEEIPYDTVCFHCQQAAEKLLKAFLVYKGSPHSFTHDLLLLLEEVLRLSPGAEPLRGALSLLMPYAVEMRHPDDLSHPSNEDAQEARDAADEVMSWLRELIPDLFA